MAPVEADDYIVQRRPHLVFVQGQDPRQHRAGAGLMVLEALLAGDEQLGDDPARVGLQAAAAAR